MATDLAFAIAVLALLGDRVPRSVSLFLLTLAIVDDIGAIVVIAVFYSHGIAFGWLGGAVFAVLAVVVLQRLGAHSPLLYVLPAVALWVCVLQSGVHTTLAGVALGLLTPARPFGGKEPIEGLEHRLHPWSSFLVVPVFADRERRSRARQPLARARVEQCRGLGNRGGAGRRETDRDRGRHRARRVALVSAGSRST